MPKIKLREARLSKGLSQKELANSIGMTQCNYSRRENGKKSISDNEWEKIAKALQVNKEEIYEVNNSQTLSIELLTSLNIPNYVLKYIKLLKKKNKQLKRELKSFKSVG